MTISLIAAIGLNNELGRNQDLLCHMPADLAHFQKLTTGSICIQGRKTYQSIVNKLGKPLPKRTNIILTRDKTFESDPSCYVYQSVDDLLHEYHNYSEDNAEVFVIGGGELYYQFLPHADRIYLTIIESKFEADTFFPYLTDDWIPVSHTEHKADEQHAYPYHFICYKRKSK